MKRLSLIAAGLLAGTSLAACEVGPNYRAPQVSTPAGFTEPAQGATSDTADLSRWWTQLGDPELNSQLHLCRDRLLLLLKAECLSHHR